MYGLFSGLCMWSIVKQLAAARLAQRERSLPLLVTSTAHVPKNRTKTINHQCDKTSPIHSTATHKRITNLLVPCQYTGTVHSPHHF